jgi:hypothetical protein
VFLPVCHLTDPPRCACFSSDGTYEQDSATRALPQLSFREDARRNAKRQAVEFGVEIGEYRGVVRVPGACFNASSRNAPSPTVR